MEYGFSSYPRFFRACLLCYGLTPHQLELEIIEELMKPQMNTDEHGEFKMQESECKTDGVTEASEASAATTG